MASKMWNSMSNEERSMGSPGTTASGGAVPMAPIRVRHVRTHTGEKPYACNWPNCDKKFTDSWKRKDHILSHSRRLMTINPMNTSVDNNNDNSLKLFVEMLNNSNNICEPIDNDIEVQQGLNEESNDFIKDELLNNNLNMFIPEVIVSEMDVSPVDGLNTSFNVTQDETKSVDQFIERTVKNEKVWYRCKWNECHYGSPKNHHLIRHIRSAHQNERPYVCEWPECAKRFTDSYKLKEHQLTHYRKVISTVGNNNKTSMNLIFDLNNKNGDKFAENIFELNNHLIPNDSNALAVVPNGQKLFNRMTFNVSDEQSSDLLAPKKVVMSIKNVEQYVDRRKIDGITRYFCKWPLCPYASNKSNHLVRHIRTHTNDKPFICDFIGCGKKFTDLWKLKIHQICHNKNESISFANFTQSLTSELTNNSVTDNSMCLVPVEDQQNYVQNPNRLLIESLTSPLPLPLPLPITYYNKIAVKPKSPVDVVMSIKNVEQYVERRKVNGITFYYCKWTNCNYGSNKSNHLVRHVRSHTGERPYECNECDKKFTDSWKLKDHKSIHAKKLLEKSLSNQKNMNFMNSLQTIENVTQIDLNDTPICGEETLPPLPPLTHKSEFIETNDSIEAIEEQDMHLLVPQVIIDESDETFVNLNESQELRVNDNNHSNDESLHGVLSLKNVEQYVEKVVKNDGNWYECKWNGCAFTTQKSSYIVQHIYKHTGEKPYKCHWSNCGAKFNKKQNLTIHMMSHTGGKPFKCHYPNCYYMAITSEALKIHFQKHNGEKPFKCGWDKCEAQFGTGIELLRHTKTHTGVRLHKCHFPNCTYASKYRNKLTIHLRRHTNDRPFKCEIDNCGKSFIVKDKLKRHELTVHRLQFSSQIIQLK